MQHSQCFALLANSTWIKAAWRRGFGPAQCFATEILRTGTSLASTNDIPPVNTTMPRLTKKQKEAGRAKKESAKKNPTNKGFKVLPARAGRDAYLGKGKSLPDSARLCR